MTLTGYLPRLLDRRIAALFTELPALLLTGPRAAGKTTTARRHVQTVVRLDQEAAAAAFRADPDAALRVQPEPVLLDEWQAVPEVLGAVKRAIDDDPRPGRFMLTGSVRADLEAATWPGTGRIIRLRMYGLTVREVLGRTKTGTFVGAMAAGTIDTIAIPPDPPDLVGYLELALVGGFPEPTLRLGALARQAWLEGYLDQLLTRDVGALIGLRDPALLRRYFEALALNTAGVVADATLQQAAAITWKTASAYERLLTNLFVLDLVPAWSANRLSRLIKGSKRYVTDPSLVGSALRLDLAGVLRDGNLLGRLLDTFVAAQIRPELDLLATRPRLYHVRQREGRHEVDLLLELGANRVIPIEIKATAAPTSHDARHLVWMRDQLGDRFITGAVLHTGPSIFQLAERVVALPICCLWG